MILSLGSAVAGFSPGEAVAVNAITPASGAATASAASPPSAAGCSAGTSTRRRSTGTWRHTSWSRQPRQIWLGSPTTFATTRAVYAYDMLSTGFMGVDHAELQLGETVAVFAQGPVDLSATIGCWLVGAGRIFAVESKSERQKLAELFGADDIIDSPRATPSTRSWT